MLDFEIANMSILPGLKIGGHPEIMTPQIHGIQAKVMYRLGTTFGPLRVRNRMPYFVINETFN